MKKSGAKCFPLEHMTRCKSMRPKEMDPSVLGELADVVAKPLSMIFKRSWQSGQVPGDWKREILYLSLKKGRKEDPRSN